MTIFITLSLAGTETGPFDLYSNVDGFTTPFDTGVSRAALLAGYETTALDGTITVRLDDLNALCTPSTTDIYTCAIPNCDFSGEIICPVTTTTTSTSSSTTTTSTLYPGVAPCTWSTYGGNPGEIAVYDFDTNLSTAVLVPNDFTTTQGINRPICSTGDKLWLASVTTDNTVAYIREWDINTSGPSPTLSYVRQITISVSTLNSGNTWGRTISAIAVTADNNTLIVGFGDKNEGDNSSMGVYSWDISTNITLNESNKITRQLVAFADTSGVLTELTGMFITNNNNVIASARYYENESPVTAANYIKEFVGLPPVGSAGNEWQIASTNKPTINLQTVGVPEFTTAWTSPNKAMPVWGVNGLLQVIQPETLGVYNISQTPNYAATLATTVADNTVWIHTSTGCANVEILNQDEIDDCTPTALPILVASNGSNYIGPITFTYSGMSVIASSNIIGGLWSTPEAPRTTDCGITIPPLTQVMIGNQSGATLDNPAFSYTLEFPVPVNNIALRTAILNTFDDFRFTTNVPSTTITIVAGCKATVQNGNELITNSGTSSPFDGSVEIVVTGSEDFTILTFVGTNIGNGGPWALGCSGFPNNNCVWATPTRGTAGYNIVYKYNPLDNTYLPQSLVPGFPITSDNNKGFVCSENTLFYLYNDSFNTSLTYIQRYDISQGLSYIDEIQVTAPIGEFIFPSNACSVDDNTLLLNSYELAVTTFTGKVWRLTINNDNTTELTFLFNLGSYRSYWSGPMFSNDKIIYQRHEADNIFFLDQRSYPSGDIELSIDITYLNAINTSPDGYNIENSTSNIFVYENKIYILAQGIKLYEIDTTFPYNTTLINANTAFYGEGQFNNQYLRAWSNAGECNADLSFTPPPVSTTTTTTTLPDVNTIWMWFDIETPA